MHTQPGIQEMMRYWESYIEAEVCNTPIGHMVIRKLTVRMRNNVLLLNRCRRRVEYKECEGPARGPEVNKQPN